MKQYGKELSRIKLQQLVGSMEQLAGVRSFTFNDGRANGVRAFDVRNGTGLCFTVLADRGMDIAYAEYRGISLAWISSAGITAPYFYEKDDREFNRTFTGGLLTTCGLTHAGEPGVDEDGERLGLHGRISNTPAERCTVSERWDGDEYIVSVSGIMRERSHGSYNLSLKRNITTSSDAPKIKITDTVCNEGFTEAPLMIIYHTNFGFPLVDVDTCVFTDAKQVLPVYNPGEKAYDDFNFGSERCDKQMFLHEVDPSAQRFSAGLYSPSAKLGVRVSFSPESMPYMIQWKLLRYQYNVLALEPSNCYAWDGRAVARKKGTLPILQPGEEKELVYHIEMIDDMVL